MTKLRRAKFKYVVKWKEYPYSSGRMVQTNKEYATDEKDASLWKKLIDKDEEVVKGSIEVKKQIGRAHV